MIYRNAPIQEAVFDIRVEGAGNVDVDTYGTYGKDHLLDYPRQEKRVSMGGTFKVSTERTEAIPRHEILGVTFTHSNNNTKTQFRRDGFSFNMLKPYSNYAEFSTEAFRLWNEYRTIVRPTTISRIALRYINRIELPLGGDFNFNNYLSNLPKIPAILEQQFSRFFLQMQVPCNDNGMYVNISQTFDQPVEGKLPFLLDIDVFRAQQFLPATELSEYFAELREFKNKIFEDLITEKTRLLFNKS